MFDLQFLVNTGEQDIKEDRQTNNSYLDYINKEFGPLSKGEKVFE